MNISQHELERLCGGIFDVTVLLMVVCVCVIVIAQAHLPVTIEGGNK